MRREKAVRDESGIRYASQQRLGIDNLGSCSTPNLTVSWDENGPLLQTAEVENPMSDRRWSAPIGQLTDHERQELTWGW